MRIKLELSLQVIFLAFITGLPAAANAEPWAPPADELVIVSIEGTEGRLIDAIDQTRRKNQLVLLSSGYGPVSTLNKYGYELAVSGGLVSAIRTFGEQKPLPIPADGFVLSADGSAITYLKRFTVGDPMRVLPSNECLPAEQAVPVLTYHKLATESSPTFIEDQFKRMRELGYSSITLDELDAWMHGMPTALPDKPIVLTFDDGRKEHYEKLPALLEKHDLQAVLFLIINQLDHPMPRYMTWSEANEMLAGGHVELQCHSYNAHRKLSHDSGKRVGAYVQAEPDQEPEAFEGWRRRDLQRCRNRLYAKTGAISRFIAWPFGAYDDAAIGAAARAGFEGMLTVHEGVNGPGTPAQVMRRISVKPGVSFDEVEERINQWRVCPLRKNELVNLVPFSNIHESSAI